MRQLKDLMACGEGAAFLAERHMYVCAADFAAQLQEPAQAALTDYFSAPQGKPVYGLQQIYTDCTPSMLERMALLRDLERHPACLPFFLWIDTDLAGSDPLMLRMLWTVFGKQVSMRLCPAANDVRELRFIPVDPAAVRDALGKLEVYLSQSITGRKKVTRARIRERLEALREVLLPDPPGMHSDLNHRLSGFLLNQQAGSAPRSVRVSELFALLAAPVNDFINGLDDAIRVFNITVEELQTQGIEPHVKPLAPDYLPLHVSCRDCRRRLRLRRETQGTDQFAAARCRCDKTYRFHLGSGRLSIDAIADHADWSPDVSLTLFLNDLVSGYVAGASSGAYYGLVMAQVLRQVFGKRRVPILLPRFEDTEAGGLLHRYLMEGTGG
jgi:hypothetical protein